MTHATLPGGFAVAALQKLTTLDYPGVVSAMIYTRGCNFHCPYCHNRQLIRSGKGSVSLEEVLTFLRKRAGLLDGLVVSGGEPTLQPGLADFCRAAKALGYRIKLDSNGSRPAVLDALLREGLLDYAAIDLKAAPQWYASVRQKGARPHNQPDNRPHAHPVPAAPGLTAEHGAFEALAQSLALLRKYDLAHEVRTTCVTPFVSTDLPEAAAPLVLNAPWLLQRARLDAEAERAGLAALPETAMEAMAEKARGMGMDAGLRE